MRVMFHNSFGNLEIDEIRSIWFSKEERSLRIMTTHKAVYTCELSYSDRIGIDDTLLRILENGFLDLTKYGTFSIYRGFKGN